MPSEVPRHLQPFCAFCVKYVLFLCLRFKDLGARRSSKGKALTLFAVCQKGHSCRTFGSPFWRGAASEIVRLALRQLLLPINNFTIQLVAPFSSDRQRG